VRQHEIREKKEMKIKDVITELDLLAPETAYVRLGDGSYIKANYRRTENPQTRQDDVTGFIKIEKVTPQAAKALGLDHKLANPNKPNRNLRPYDIPKANFTSQGQDPFSPKHIYVVDMKDKESMSHLTDKVTAKILQYLEKNAGKTT
jgi:hypothetical protein